MPRSFRKAAKNRPIPPPPPLPEAEKETVQSPLDYGDIKVTLLRDKSKGKSKKPSVKKLKKQSKSDVQRESLYGVGGMPCEEMADEEVEVKFTIHRSISGTSFPSPTKTEDNGSVISGNKRKSYPISIAECITSPASPAKLSVSPVMSDKSSVKLSSRTPEIRRKIPLPPRAPLSYRSSRPTSVCSEARSCSSSAATEVRRHSPEGVEESPRRTSTSGHPTDLPLRGATVLRSTSIVMERPASYASPTARITAGPTLTMRPPTPVTPPTATSTHTQEVDIDTPGEPSRNENIYRKHVIPKPKSHYETPLPPKTPPKTPAKKHVSPYDKPDISSSGLVAARTKLTSPYQRPTVIAPCNDDVLPSIVTTPPVASSSSSSVNTPPLISPYRKPIPPTRSATLSGTTSNNLATFVRQVNPGLRSSFMGPPTPLKNTQEYEEKVETIYALPSEDPLDLYSDDTLKAIKGISDKYDTSQRRQLQAMSFRDTTAERKAMVARAPSSGGTSVDMSPMSDTDLPDAPDIDELLDMTEDTSPLVTADDLARIELFYASRDSHVCVCRCHAVVQTTTLTGQSAQWRALHRGVPVWLLTDGTHRRDRELRYVLAEPSTAFPIWIQKVSDPESYSLQEPDTHDIFSLEENQTFRVHYKDDRAAGRFLTYFRKLTSNRNDRIWNPNGKQPKVKARKHVKVTTVGEPCAFNHVTRVKDIRNSRLLDSLSEMIMKTASYRGTSTIARSLSNVLLRPVSTLRRHSNVSSSVYSCASSSAASSVKTINDTRSYVG